VGIVNTAVSYGTYALFLSVGLTYALASFSALLVGLVVAFRTQGAFVFDNSDKRLFFRYAVCWGIIYLINTGLIGMLIGWGLSAYAAGAVTLPLIALLSFLMGTFVFKRTAHKDVLVPGTPNDASREGE